MATAQRKTSDTVAFKVVADFVPSGDQPQAVGRLIEGATGGMKHQTLMGVTGSGKTYTMAKVVEGVQRPTLLIAPNKTLAAQLAQEFRDFFPDNAVEYFTAIRRSLCFDRQDVGRFTHTIVVRGPSPSSSSGS